MGNSSSVQVLVMKGNAEELTAALDEDENLIHDLKSEEGIATVHLAAILGHLDIVLLLLERGIDINCRVSSGETLLFSAIRRHHGLLAACLLNKGIDVNIKNSDNETALHVAAICGHHLLAKMLLCYGIEIDDDINTYAPQENEDEQHEDGTITYVEDSRPIIFAAMENRRKRAIFDDFVDKYIEYQPYIDNIYTQCFTSVENIKVIPPRAEVGWARTEEIRNNYYLDEVFFHLHLHVANLYTNTQPDAIITTSSTNSMSHGANNSDKTSTLMTILTDKLRLMLKPDQNLAIEVPYVQRDTDERDDDDDDDDDDNNNDEDNNDIEEVDNVDNLDNVDNVDNEEVDNVEG